MALIKLFKLGSAGIAQEHDAANDDIEFNSLTVDSLTVNNNFTANSANVIQSNYTAGATIAARDVVYLSGADAVSPADASAEATARVIGLAVAGSSAGGLVSVRKLGVMSGFSALTPGARYFLDPAAGAISASIPAANLEAVIQVGYAKSATELDIQVEPVLIRYTS